MLAGLLKAPSKYSPSSNPPMALERAHSVLTKMVEAGLLSPEEGENAARAVPHFSQTLQRGQSGVDYAVDAVLERLPSLVAAPASEIVIDTTIDANLQRRAQSLVQGCVGNRGRVHKCQPGRPRAHGLGRRDSGARRWALVRREPV